MNKDTVIHLENLTKVFKVGERDFSALKNINLDIVSGEFSGLVGPSGSGKTTLLNIIGSLDKPSEGGAVVLGHDIATLSNQESAHFRNREIAFIFQVYNLLPVYTVYENVEFALLLQSISASERRKRVNDVLEWVGLSDLADKKPDKLSGGESQRIAIARAMVKRPNILLADEPTANLDAVNAEEVLKTMQHLNQTLGTTFLFSTHDEKVMRYLKRIIRLEDGQVVADKQQEVLEQEG